MAIDWTSWPDEAFPYLPGRGMAEAVLYTAVARGHLWTVDCRACGHAHDFNGAELAHLWPTQLDMTIGAWARALRCSACGSRRIQAGHYADPSALNTRRSTNDEAHILHARRAHALLSAEGVDFRRYRPLDPDMPAECRLQADGIG